MSKKQIIITGIATLVAGCLLGGGLYYRHIMVVKAQMELIESRNAQFESIQFDYDESEQTLANSLKNTNTKNYQNELVKYKTGIAEQTLTEEDIEVFNTLCEDITANYEDSVSEVKDRASKLKATDMSGDEDLEDTLSALWADYEAETENMNKASSILDKIEKRYADYVAEQEKIKEAEVAKAETETTEKSTDNTNKTETTTQNNNVETTEQTVEPVAEAEIVETNTTENKDSVCLSVSNIEQNPELPTGCEAVAATIVLNYYGAGMSKTEMVDNYLPYSDSPYSGFVGSPYEQPNGHGHWCAAAPIVVAMNNAIAAHGMNCSAVNVSGSSFDTILDYVKNGKPVVFWGYENMSRGYHTLALIGYDKNAGVCYFADPLKSGIQTYSMDATRNAYANRGSQAVIVQ